MSLVAGLNLKCEGQRIVSENEKAEWRELALNLLHKFATDNPYVRADKFDEFRIENGLGDPHHPNVIGTLFSTAASKKWLVRTARSIISEKTESRAHQCLLWRSLLCSSALQEANDGHFYGIKAERWGGWFFETEAEALAAIEDYAKGIEVPLKSVSLHKF